MRKSKKGDLSLSINAIVILILAITMLGLGLAFMRNIFGSATKEFEEVGGTVKKQMIDQMKESSKIVDLSRPKVELKAGESTQVFIGFKNDGNDVKHFLIKSPTSTPPSTKTPTPLGGIDKCNLVKGGENKQVYLEFKGVETQVLKGDVVVLPINVKTTSDVEQDTCFYELEVTYDSAAPTALSATQTVEFTVDITN
jgi:hypothetical protein